MKTVLITGGSSGLGKELASQLKDNYNVVILCFDQEKVQGVASELECNYAVADVTQVAKLQEAVDQVVQEHGQIDVLINSAGIWAEGQLDETDPEYIQKVIDVNLVGTMLATQVVLPHMRKQKSGMIFNIISQAGRGAKKNRSVYYASKWGVRGFTQCLQHDVQEEGIRVTAVYPGVMDTALFDSAGNSRDLSKALSPAETAKSIKFVMELGEDTHIPCIDLRSISEV